MKEDDDSGFLDEDIKKDIIFDKQSGILPGFSTRTQFSSLINDYKASERKVDEYLNKRNIEESDLDIVKQNQIQLSYLKEQIKELNQKYNLLTEQVKELLKNIKVDIKIKPQVSQICQILGYSPQTINRIVTNKKKVII